MSEIINKNKYLDFEGLKKYDSLIKGLIKSGNEELAAAIAALDAKIGSLDFEGSDGKTLTEFVEDIYTTIVEIVLKQDSFDEKNVELEGKINDIVGDLESLEDSDSVMTLVEIRNELKELDKLITKNSDVINILNGEGDGSVKKTVADAQAAAEENAKTYADGLVKDADGNSLFDESGAAANALEDAKAYADEKAGNNAELINGLTNRIGSLEGISQASDVKYEDGYINLYDANGEKIGDGFDASPFIIDGMLKSVSFVDDSDSETINTTLRFTFNTDSGVKDIDVDFSDYVDIYHADGSSIELNSSTNTFSVKEVAATKTKTVETIPVAGGPLESLLKGAGITEIAAGSSIEDVLFSLICKEKWATTLTFSEGTVASSIAQPTFTLTNSGKTVEVGTKCTLSEITMGAATPSISKNRTYSGFTYGYSAENDNSQDSANTSITAGVDVAAALNEGNYTMTRDYTQFNGATDDSATADATASNVKLGGAELTVSYVGSNSVKVTVGGPTASATFAAMPVYYACSNLKKTKDAAKDSEGQYKSEAKDAKKVTSSAASNSKTLTVTGARAFWTGSVKTAMTEFTSATVRAAGNSTANHLTKTLGTSVPATITAKGGDAQVVIATQKEVTAVNSKNQIGANVFGNFTHRTVTIEGANGFTGISYHVYEWTPANPFDKDDILTITYK